MAPTLDVVLHNDYAPASKMYAHITGSDDEGVMMIAADGKTVHRPKSPSDPLQPLGADCSILLGPHGSERTVKVPRMSGGRIWFCRDKPLKFFINPGPALVEPSPVNESDENYNLDWSFCEFTWNENELYINVSFVDFVSQPISLKLRNEDGKEKSVAGMPSDCLNSICDKLEAQSKKDGKGWDKLVIKDSSGNRLRALSPVAGSVLHPDLFVGYYDSYVDKAWEKYGNENLTINSQTKWGDFVGRVQNGKLTFDGVGSFAKPSTMDVFTCSTGPFAAGEGVSPEKLNLGARLAASINRSTLAKNSKQPEGENPDSYYTEDTTNHYSRICHETSINKRGYAFPYDDVGPSEGVDQSGFINDPKPQVLTITVGKSS